MSLLRSVKTLLHNGSHTASNSSAFTTAKTETDLFAATHPDTDGPDCLHDCETCTTSYPRKFSIDESDRLYGHVKGWSTHLVVGTGRTDWVRDVTDEKHSVMQAVGKAGIERRNGKIMLSASSMPSGEECHGHGVEEGTSDCLLLPAWVVVEAVAPSRVPGLLTEVVEASVTNTTPVVGAASRGEEQDKRNEVNGEEKENATQNGAQDEEHLSNGADPTAADETSTLEPTPLPPSISSSFKIRPIPHDYLILMCSHKTRDARCGQSAPLLRKEFERVLRPLGLYRDVHDDRPGGVGIYFINHVGGHKYSANVMIYRRGKRKDGANGENQNAVPRSNEAVQLVWLARIRPEECENIVRYTVLQGKVVKPGTQLRGGFDRERGLTSW